MPPFLLNILSTYSELVGLYVQAPCTPVSTIYFNHNFSNKYKLRYSFIYFHSPSKFSLDFIMIIKIENEGQ